MTLLLTSGSNYTISLFSLPHTGRAGPTKTTAGPERGDTVTMTLLLTSGSNHTIPL